MPNQAALQEQTHAAESRLAWTIGAIAFLIQMVFNGRYGYFRDELYFIACSNHLAFGYVDFAPLIAWLTRGFRMVFGDSLHAIRLLPALAFGAEVALTGFITRELGGRRWAIFLACVSVLVAPVILANGTRLAMNPIEPLFWMGCIYVLLLAINRDRPKLLVWCGILLGFGLLNKHSTVFFIAAVVIGLLLSSERRLLFTKWFWLAAAIAFCIALPNVIWQYVHHFPTLEDLRNVKATHKNIELPPLAFLQQQMGMLNPWSVFVWLGGLFYLLFHPSARRFRFLAYTYLLFLAVMMFLKGKDYYLAPIYPMLYAAGAVLWETAIQTYSRVRWLRFAIPAFIIFFGLVAAPLVLPILPPEKIPVYMNALGIKMTHTENGMVSVLPQHFADEFGWPEMVATVAGVYNSLPPGERAETAILAGNYGGAGAIDFFGPRYGLPKAISAHQNYYYWGPRNYTGESVILLEWDLDDAKYWCGTVDVGPKIAPPLGMGWEHYNILLCHNFKVPLSQAWPRLKTWN
ncbi:MAG: glycosyltransferase family 39 protein [Candidatus Acidiferrum sp.]